MWSDVDRFRSFKIYFYVEFCLIFLVFVGVVRLKDFVEGEVYFVVNVVVFGKEGVEFEKLVGV